MIRQAMLRLAASGVESPRRNAEILLAYATATGKDRALEPLLLRRERREPLEYITGKVSFAGIELRCDRRALIPRPETEDLVTMAVEAVKGIAEPRIADIGTGTGAIALAIKALLPKATLVGTDLSAEALSLARENAAGLGLKVDFRLGKDLEPLKEERFDAIVGNPPYIPESDYPDLMQEVRDWEPREALVGGPEGTEVLRRWLAQSRHHLRPEGWVGMEAGIGQARRVLQTLAGQKHWKTPESHADFRGVDRFLTARG